jgi:hypothetical protein
MIIAKSSSLLTRQYLVCAARTLPSVPSYFSTGVLSKDVISKRDIVEEIAETHELSFAKSERILNTVIDTIVEVSQ